VSRVPSPIRYVRTSRHPFHSESARLARLTWIRKGVWLRRRADAGTNPKVPLGRTGRRALYQIPSPAVTCRCRSNTCGAPCALIRVNEANVDESRLGAALASTVATLAVPIRVSRAHEALVEAEGEGAGTGGLDGRPGVWPLRVIAGPVEQPASPAMATMVSAANRLAGNARMLSARPQEIPWPNDRTGGPTARSFRLGLPLELRTERRRAESSGLTRFDLDLRLEAVLPYPPRAPAPLSIRSKDLERTRNRRGDETNWVTPPMLGVSVERGIDEGKRAGLLP